MIAVVVQPVRFTDHVAEMQSFLELIGLRPWVVDDAGGWSDMSAGGGRVALHAAASATSGALPGQTTLSFEADDVTELAKQLTASGIAAVTVYDEAYGRVLTCVDPAGDIVAVNERTDDHYGYQFRGESAAEGSLRVTPVRFTDPAGAYGAFLVALGLRPAGEINEYYVNFLSADGARGQVGLHHVVSGELPIVTGGRAPAVQLNFESGEPLADIAVRLTGVGFPAEITTEDFGSFLTVVDPDGQQVQVHEPPTRH